MRTIQLLLIPVILLFVACAGSATQKNTNPVFSTVEECTRIMATLPDELVKFQEWRSAFSPKGTDMTQRELDKLCEAQIAWDKDALQLLAIWKAVENQHTSQYYDHYHKLQE